MLAPQTCYDSRLHSLLLFQKTESTSHLSDFRLISIIHSLDKIISKVLAIWLASLLDNLVDKAQIGFIQGRIIADNFLSACENLHHCKRNSLICAS